jgi:O-antigen/teichoic acid export membrane protein
VKQIGRAELGLNHPDTRGGFRRQVVRNGATTVGGNLWALIVGAITLPITLRGLGREQFGLWVLIQTLSAVSGWLSLTDLGLRTAAVRAIAGPLARGEQAVANRIAGSTVRLLVALGVVTATAMYVFGRFALPSLFGAPAALEPEVRLALTWFALQVALELALIAMQCLLEGSQRIDVARGVHALRQTFVGVGVAVAASTSHRLPVVAATSAVGTGLALLAAIALVWSRALVRPAGSSLTDVRELATYGVQIGAINATGVLHRTMDRVIVGAIYGPAPVALIEVATQISNGAQTMLTTSHAITAAAPWLHARAEPARLRTLLLRGTKLTTLASIPAIVIATVLAGPIITMWMGPSYREAAGLTALAVLGVALAAPAQAASLILQGTGRAKAVLLPATIAVLANLGLSIWFAHALGLAGVFVATAVTAAALMLPLIGAALRATDTTAEEFLADALRPAVLPTLAALGGASIGLLANSPLVQVGTGTVFGVAAWGAATWFVALRADERHELRTSIAGH